jgi:multidrug resistance efflux pump
MNKRNLIIGLVLLLAVAGGGGWWWQSQAAKATGDTLLEATGTVEARKVSLAPQIGGQVVEVLVEEGQRVTAGQPVLRLDDSQLVAQRAQAEASVRLAQARLEEIKAGARPQEIEAVQVAVEAAGAQLRRVKRGARPEEIAVAEAAVEVARAGVQTAEGVVAGARANLARIQAGPTQEEIAIAQRQVEQAKNALWGGQSQRDSICGQAGSLVPQSNCDSARAAVQSAEEQVRITELQLQQLQRGARQEDMAAAQAQLQQALGQLATAQAQLRQAEAVVAQAKMGPAPEDITAAEAGLRQAQANLTLIKAGARAETIAAAQAQVDAAQAQLDALDVQLEKFTITSPWDGVVLTRSVEPGETVMPGATLLGIGRLDLLELTVYLPEDQFGLVTPGQEATVRVDAYPDRVFSGTVLRVSDEAEFTPTNVQTKDDRVRLVYAVVISLENPDPSMGSGQGLALKPGMIADVAFGK